MPDPFKVILLLLGAYVLGSIPTSVWLSKWLYRTDIRTLGSGNAGSTNMYRSFGFKAGFITQIVDILKGSIASGLPIIGLPDSTENTQFTLLMLGCGVLAVVGHTFPVFAGFRGGKGVNTILGMMAVMHPTGTISSLLVFALVLLIGKMVSLASILAVYSFFLFGLVTYWVQQPGGTSLLKDMIFIGLGLILSIYITWSHRSNIGRIRTGTERKIKI